MQPADKPLTLWQLIFRISKSPNDCKASLAHRSKAREFTQREGTYEESGRWFEDLAAAFPDDNFVSPGGVAMFAEVSRAAVHKRLNEGKLTAFAFYVTKVERTIFGHRKKLRQNPYMYIPVSECKAWAKELEQRPERQEKK